MPPRKARWARVFPLMLLGVCVPAVDQAQALGFDPGETGFAIEIEGLGVNYREFAWYVMPGARVEIRARISLQARAADGVLAATANGWTWTAPSPPGLHRVTLTHGDDSMRLNLFVMRPAAEIRDGRLGGYRIGQYAQRPFRDLAAYRPPEGFVEVTPDLAGVRVSPHFTFGQFLSKQASGWPKYLVVRPQLAIKLERALAAVNAAGIATDSFVIMSGYRTPWYNRAIGNRTSSSRHLYGGAADIFVDVSPRDGVMDDLNGDGRIDKADARYLYDLFEGWSRRPWWRRLQGGLAAYGGTAAHGPFVHVDARGHRARW